MKEIKICSRCIMDNNVDNLIQFNEQGECNYCTEALNRSKSTYYPNEKGEEKLSSLILQIKKEGEGKKYDCVMGVSGGLDSSYLAYLGHKWGLRILAIHIDDGFDTDISKRNLEKLIKACNYNYKIIYPDAEQFNAITKTYMKAGVANIAIPQDNLLFAAILKYMKENNIKYFLSGGNFSLESILSTENTHSAYDVKNIKDIHKKYGEKPIDKLTFISSNKRIIYKKIYGIKTVLPLNYIDYNRQHAFDELKNFSSFEYYGSKHLENKLTAFIQLCWFPQKFHEDKRKAHYSSMIISNQLTRNEALEKMEEPLFDQSMMVGYIAEIKEKLMISDNEFEDIMNAPTRKHTDFKIEDNTLLYKTLRMLTKSK